MADAELLKELSREATALEELPSWVDAPARSRPRVLFDSALLEAVGYDTIYALQDIEDDRRIGVRSSALYFRDRTWLAVACAFAMMLALLGLAGSMAGIGWSFYGVLGAVGLWCSKQVNEIRRPILPARAFELFQEHTWIGTTILAGFYLGFVLKE
jgi:4-hydroxybenzoate polyprenyltransferase